MKISDINPFIRFANEITYHSEDRELAALDCRLLYITRGEGEVILNGKAHRVTGGSLIYARAGIPYKFSPCVLGIFSINFDMDQSRTHITECMNKIAPEQLGEKCIELPHIEDGRFLNECLFLEKATVHERELQRIADEFGHRRPCFAERGSALLKCLLLSLLRERINESIGRSTAGVIEYINENYKRKLTNAELAERAGYHEYHLNRLLKKEMGITLHKYVLRLRITEAERLLLITDMSVADISEEVGFESATHFATQFKVMSGCTPLEYRKKYKQSI